MRLYYLLSPFLTTLLLPLFVFYERKLYFFVFYESFLSLCFMKKRFHDKFHSTLSLLSIQFKMPLWSYGFTHCGKGVELVIIISVFQEDNIFNMEQVQEALVGASRYNMSRENQA